MGNFNTRTLLEKCNAEEIRARNFAKQLEARLRNEYSRKSFDDFEIEAEFSAASDNEVYCISKNKEPGESLIDSRILGYHLWLGEDALFAENWIEYAWRYHKDFQHLHFGYLMHCLVFHSFLNFEDLLMIDDVQINVVVRCQFFTDKAWVEELKKINSKMDAETVKQIEILNEKCHAEEIRARNFTKSLKAELKNEKAAGKIDGFDITVELRAFSNDEAFCKSRNIEPGESLFDRYELAYSLFLEDDEFFNANGNKLSNVDGHPLQHLHFGYLMHCLVFHSDLSFEELAKIDDVWIDVLVKYNFFCG